MNPKQQHALEVRNTDLQGAVQRLGGNEQLYLSCLSMFLEDSTIVDLNRAIKAKSGDDAFTAAHALKGLAGNMGFIPLMHSTSQLVIMIRGGRIKELSEYMTQVNSSYRDIVDAIRENFGENTKGEKNESKR